MNQRFLSNHKTVQQALATFDSDKTKQIVPDPRLRAALVALKGTAGETSIAGVLDGTYSSAKFGNLDNLPAGTIAQVQDAGDGTLQIVFNQRYQYEDFRLLASVYSHESLHHDLRTAIRKS